MSLREKYAAAKAAQPQLSPDLVQINYALMTFTQSIPQMMQTAIDRTTAGEVLDAGYERIFKQLSDISGSVRHSGETDEKLKQLTDLPGMQALKAYLSDPDVDLAFEARLEEKSRGTSYTQKLVLVLHPDLPFAKSSVSFRDGEKVGAVVMTENDRLAWAAAAKPKMPAPARLTKP